MTNPTILAADDLRARLEPVVANLNRVDGAAWRIEEDVPSAVGSSSFSDAGAAPLVVDPALCAAAEFVERLGEAGSQTVVALTDVGTGDSLSTLRNLWKGDEDARRGIFRLTRRIAHGASDFDIARLFISSLLFLGQSGERIERVRCVGIAGRHIPTRQLLAIIRMKSRMMVHLDCAVGPGFATLDSWEYAWRGGLMTWDERADRGIETGDREPDPIPVSLEDRAGAGLRSALLAAVARAGRAESLRSELVALQEAGRWYAAAQKSISTGEVVTR